MAESPVNLHACRDCGNVISTEYTDECTNCGKEVDDAE